MDLSSCACGYSSIVHLYKLKNNIHRWGENFIPVFESWMEEPDIEPYDPQTKEIMSLFADLVTKYPFLKTDKEESCHMWLVTMKMYLREEWEHFDGKPIYFIKEIEKRIERLFPNL